MSPTNPPTDPPGASPGISSDAPADRQYLPPWIGSYIIGIAGISGSGKTSVASQIIKKLNQPWTVLLSMDNYYNPLTKEESARAFRNEFDFDTPKAIDLDLLVQTLTALKKGHHTEIPIYSFSEHARTSKTFSIYGANVVILEGIYALYDKRVLDMMDMKIYVDTDLDICLARRINRDIVERGRDLHGAIKQWNTFVKPNAERFVKPTMNSSNVIVPRGADNTIAIDLLVKHIQKQLNFKSKQHLQHLINLGTKNELKPLPSNVKILKNTNQLECMNTILLDQDTTRDDFIFYFDRISNILINEALKNVTYEPFEVKCHNDHIFKGLKQVETLCAVNLIRSGDCFMRSLKKSVPDIPIGKLLIQSDSRTGEPQLHTQKLPPCITMRAPGVFQPGTPNSLINGNGNHSKTTNIGKELEPLKVLLIDAQASSGAAAIMATQVLIDHGLKQEDIIFVVYITTELAVRRLLAAFPRITVIVGKMGHHQKTSNGSLLTSVGCEEDSEWWCLRRFVDAKYFGT